VTTKDQIQAELEGLDEALLADIYLFIKTFIRSKQVSKDSTEVPPGKTLPSAREFDTENDDPLEGFLGAIAHGSLASDLDSELYGN